MKLLQNFKDGTHKGALLFFLMAVLAAAVFVWRGVERKASDRWTQNYLAASKKSFDDNQALGQEESGGEGPDLEKEFVTPIPINWVGKLGGCFQSCEGYFVKMIEGNKDYVYFKMLLPDSMGSGKLMHGVVRVEGKWIGNDCAYARTALNGECGPVVEASRVTPID